jgi:16S rRNA G1207 methylase RsmC
MAHQRERGALLEGLLGDGVFALEALLSSPDLHLDCLEQATRDALEVAQETWQAVKAEMA